MNDETLLTSDVYLANPFVHYQHSTALELGYIFVYIVFSVYNGSIRFTLLYLSMGLINKTNVDFLQDKSIFKPLTTNNLWNVWHTSGLCALLSTKHFGDIEFNI